MSDDTQVRSFAAFPPGRRATGRARSWWGDAWLTALEATALDAGQLRHGRTVATRGLVGAIAVSPGRVSAVVQDADGAAYETVVRVPVLEDDAWERVGAQLAARAGNVAALLDGELPRELAEDAADVGVPLVPETGDLEPACTCDGWELPCRHAAALCYQVARLLDGDPFVLLLLRGRDREAVVGDVDPRQRTGTTTEDAATAVPPPDEDPRDRALRLLVTDAARRARAALATGDPSRSALYLDADADVERWVTWYGQTEGGTGDRVF